MTDDNVAFDRVRGADPAAGVEPDLEKIHAVVAHATGVPLAHAMEARPFTELAERRSRTRTRWMQAAAAVAAIAVVGTGGYAIGGGFGGSGGETAVALPPISLSAGGGGDTAAAPETAMAADAAGGRSMLYPGWFGRTVFTGKGLSTDGGSATAYGFDASSVTTAETAARIAAALGVTGEPRAEWGSWVVGPNDGSGPTVTLSGDGMASISYYDPARDAWLCENAGGAEPAVDPSTTAEEKAKLAGVPAPHPGVCEAGSTPTGDAAIAMAREVLGTIGVDLTDAEVFVDDSGAKATDLPGAGYVSVQFSQVVEGQQSGVQYSVTLVGDGVQSLYAALGTLVDLGEYGVISAAEAVDRLNDPRFGAPGGVIAYGRELAADTAVASDEPAQEPTVPPAPQAGASISWPVEHVTLTSARLGLAMVTLSTGGQALVPAYELSDANGTTWSVIAVVDSQLDFGTK